MLSVEASPPVLCSLLFHPAGEKLAAADNLHLADELRLLMKNSESPLLLFFIAAVDEELAAADNLIGLHGRFKAGGSVGQSILSI